MRLTNQSFLRVKNILELKNWFYFIKRNRDNSGIVVWNKRRNSLVIYFDHYKNTAEMIEYINYHLSYTELTLIHGDAWMSRRSKAELKLIVNRKAA